MATNVRDGSKLAYEDRGAGGPAFVFVHGWTCDRTFFASQAAHFGRLHRVVSVDLRGHGESDAPRGPYPINAYAADVAHLIDRLELGKIVMVDPGTFELPPKYDHDSRRLCGPSRRAIRNRMNGRSRTSCSHRSSEASSVR